MNYNSNNFQDETIEEKLANAETRRIIGREKQQDIEHFELLKGKAMEAAEIQGKTPQEFLIDLIRQHPDDINSLMDYLEQRGYTPDSNLLNLAMQVMHARDEEIDERMRMYDADNFLFGGKGKAERIRRRAERVTARNSVRLARQEGKTQRKAARAARKGEEAILDEQGTEQAQEEQSQQEQVPYREDAQKTIIDDGDINMDAHPPTILNPTREEAEAEILGEEEDLESYDGEQKTFNTILNSAVDLGRRTVADVKAQQKKTGKKVNLKGIFQLFKKNTKAVAQDVERDITVKKKNDYIKDNTPMLIGGVILLVGIGYLLNKGGK